MHGLSVILGQGLTAARTFLPLCFLLSATSLALSGRLLSDGLYSDFTRTVTLSSCLPSPFKLLTVSGLILCGSSYLIWINTTVLQLVKSPAPQIIQDFGFSSVTMQESRFFLLMDIFCSVLPPLVSGLFSSHGLSVVVWLGTREGQWLAGKGKGE